MDKYRKITVDVRDPFDPNADNEAWAKVGRAIDEIARSGDPIRNPFPARGCVITDTVGCSHCGAPNPIVRGGLCKDCFHTLIPTGWHSKL